MYRKQASEVDLSRRGPDLQLNGILLAPFNKRSRHIPRHPLDTEIEEYYRLLNEVIVPDCMEIGSDTEVYPQRIKKLIPYVTPAFFDHWGFGVELVYRMLAPLEHQTSENLTKVRILRIIQDLIFSMGGVLDDISDDSDLRRNKKPWHLICPGGPRAAVYDGAALAFFAFKVLKSHFRNDPGYALMMEYLSQTCSSMMVGQVLDICSRGIEPTTEYFFNLSNYKGGLAFSQTSLFGAVYAQVTDENILETFQKVFAVFGRILHIWDDFQDYYNISEKTGKPPCDFYNTGCTWVHLTALKHFDEHQKKIFKFVPYVTPLFLDHLGFGVELVYRMLAPPEHQTPENLTKVRILRIIQDLIFSMAGVLDDISDDSDLRLNKKPWHLICPGGPKAAMYDGAALAFFAFKVLKSHFRNDPGYPLMMEYLSQTCSSVMVGQVLDICSREIEPTTEYFFNLSNYKAGLLISQTTLFGAVYAQVTDENILETFQKVFAVFGRILLVWDDFQDYYNKCEKTGKPPCDFYNTGCTWVHLTALKYFDEHQKKIFKECYGSRDPEKVETAMALLDEIDIPRKYILQLRQAFLEAKELIEQFPEQRFKEPCYSYMSYLLQDVTDPYFEETKLKLNL